MAATLLLRLEGPMQSWGIDSRFDIRETLREPTKSGVIGLLCSALGKPRREAVDDGWPTLAALGALRMGVRVDREGTPGVDYQTAGGEWRSGQSYGVCRASGKPGDTVQSWRHYLADASFLVGMEGDPVLLELLGRALAAPKWVLSLGRKAFVPGVPVHMPSGVAGPGGVAPLSLGEALRRMDWIGNNSRRRAVIEVPYGEHLEARHDVPLDFDGRRFGVRYVAVRFFEQEA